MTDARGSALTVFQLEVAAVFFSLPSSEQFLLAGGAALVAQGLTARPTQDLDFFTAAGAEAVHAAREEFTVAARTRGWSVTLVREQDTFCRLLVHGPEDLLVDIAVDASPGQSATASFAGPTFSREELAGRKLLALFDRAAARDFVDVYMLTRTFTPDELLTQARNVDEGFDAVVLVDMIGYLDRYTNTDLDLGDVDVHQLRAFFATWRRQIPDGPGQPPSPEPG